MASHTDGVTHVLYDVSNVDVMPKFVPPGFYVFSLEDLILLNIPDPETDMLSALHFANRLHVLAASLCAEILRSDDIGQWKVKNQSLVDHEVLGEISHFSDEYFGHSIAGCWDAVCIPECTDNDIGWSSGTIFFLAWANVFTLAELLGLVRTGHALFTPYETLAIPNIEMNASAVYQAENVHMDPLWHWPHTPFNMYSQFQLLTQIKHLAIRWDFIDATNPALAICIDKIFAACAHMCTLTFDVNNQYIIDLDESYASNCENMGIQESEIGEDNVIDEEGNIVDNNLHRTVLSYTMSNRFVYETVTLLMYMKAGVRVYQTIIDPSACSLDTFFGFASETLDESSFVFVETLAALVAVFAAYRVDIMNTSSDFDRLCADRIIVDLMPARYRELFCQKNYWILLNNKLYLNAEMTPILQYGTRATMLRDNKFISFDMSLFPARIQLVLLSQSIAAMTMKYDTETPRWMEKFYVPEAKACRASRGIHSLTKLLTKRKHPFVTTIGSTFWVYTHIDRFVQCASIDEVFVVWCLSYIIRNKEKDAYYRLVLNLFCEKPKHVVPSSNMPEHIRAFLSNLSQ